MKNDRSDCNKIRDSWAWCDSDDPRDFAGMLIAIAVTMQDERATTLRMSPKVNISCFDAQKT